MAIPSKPIASVPNTTSVTFKSQPNPTEIIDKLEPKLQHARQLMAKGDYQKALTTLPSSNRDLEVRNVCAVCLMRMNRFEEAIDLLRPVTVNSSIHKMREDVPIHIRINFATALYFGGRPAGGLEALQEIGCEDHSAVKLVREHARHWVAQMSFIRRIDWRLNGIAPKKLPAPPSQSIGICVWELE
ncbi:MAG TPA: hypothetical protein DDZ51_11395 [Planctomycetaceae bacterium]|nr:hypothetical protein [Planctomycetaceae bacterium]